nr:cytosine deaminase [Roseibium aquae]
MDALCVPLTGDAVLLNGRVPASLLKDPLPSGSQSLQDGDLLAVDIEIRNGRIAAIQPLSGSRPSAGSDARVDLDGGLVLPCLVDMHTHLDKGHIWPRKPNPDGSFMGALTAVGEDRAANWSAADLTARMEFALRCAYAHGTAVIRTHIDSLPPQDGISWPVFEMMRDRWAGRIAMQGVCLFGIERVAEDPGYLPRIADRMAQNGGVLGGVTYMVPDLERDLEAVFRTAMERGLDLDFHVDETLDPEAVSLKKIAETALRLQFPGRIVAGHCCSLAMQPEKHIQETLDLVAQAGIGVVSLPMCNLYLQDRQKERTPRRRGVTLLHELKDRGIPVAVASDNTRDPFFAYGDLDLIEVYAQATRIAHLDHPVGDWITAVSSGPADMIGLAAGRFEVGGPADVLIFRVRSWNELLSRPHGPRTVLRAGRTIDRTLPDFRELDHLMKTEDKVT